MTNSNFIEVSAPSSQPQAQPGLVVTLEGANLLITIILSLAGLLAIVVRSVTQFNYITSEIKDLREDSNNHSNSEGHNQLSQQIKQIQTDLSAIDKKIDLHLLDYIHYKDSNLLHHNGSREKIDHTWKKTENLFIEQKAEIKEIQRFLQKQQDFTIRE